MIKKRYYVSGAKFYVVFSPKVWREKKHTKQAEQIESFAPSNEKMMREKNP